MLDFSLLSRPRNRMEILGILAQCRPMILYREKTQIRFCINIADTGKREKCYILKYVIEICLFVLFCSDIKRTFRLKAICCMITRNDNSLIIIAVVNTGVIFLILFYNDPL